MSAYARRYYFSKLIQLFFCFSYYGICSIRRSLYNKTVVRTGTQLADPKNKTLGRAKGVSVLGSVSVANSKAVRAKKNAARVRDRERHKSERYKHMARARRRRGEGERGEQKSESKLQQTDIRSYAERKKIASASLRLASSREPSTNSVSSVARSTQKDIREYTEKKMIPAQQQERGDKKSDTHSEKNFSAEGDRNTMIEDEGDEEEETDVLFSLTVGNEKAKERNLAQVSASILSNSKRIFFDRIFFLLDCMSTKECEGLYTGEFIRTCVSLERSFFSLSLSLSRTTDV